jgi:16S rRNA processing protein RimM
MTSEKRPTASDTPVNSALSPDFRRIGLIVAAQGLRGELRIKPYNVPADWTNWVREVAVLPSESASTPNGTLKVLSAKPKDRVVLMTFDGIRDRTEAERWVGKCLVVFTHQFPPLTTDEVYVDTLRGLAVWSVDSTRLLGKINDVLTASAGEYLEVIPEGKRLADAVLIPYQAPFIHSVDEAQGQLWLKGLDEMFVDGDEI